MRRRIALYGVTPEAAALLPLLDANPTVAIVAVFDHDPDAARQRIAAGGLVAKALPAPSADPAILEGDPDLHAVIDAGVEPPFASRFPALFARGIQVVTPLTARLLWGYGYASRDHKNELLQALHEIVESVNLTVDADELFGRMLEIALGVTGADRGSLMLFDPESRLLRIRVAVGIEPELWPKIRVGLGEGIAGKAAAEARPLRVQGKADRERFRIVHERLDVASALCVPLLREGQLLGVLSLAHSAKPDAFTDADLEFAERLGRLDAQIIARAQEHETLRSQAARYAAVREVHALLEGKAPLLDRLRGVCLRLAERAGKGITTLYLHEPETHELRVAASSLGDSGLGSEYRVRLGEGVDGRVALTRKPTFLHGGDGALAYAALPLLAGDQLVGVLSVQAGSEAPRGRAVEETLLEVAAAAADEIAHADREARMSARATKVNAINETGIRLISARDPTEVVRLATSSAALILEADHAVLRLQDESTRRYVIRSYFGPADGPHQEKLFRLDKRICVDVIKRRSPVLLRDLREDPAFREFAGVARSALGSPLSREGRVIGTLVLYDKVIPDRFYPSSFNDDDVQVFSRFVSYVERAVANALYYAKTRSHRSFDEETGLPNAAYLGKRIDEEIARARARESSLAVAVCRIENIGALRQGADPVRADRVVRRAMEALQSHLRDFDVLGRTEDDAFTVLLPDPGPAPEERVYAVARAVADEISKDDREHELRAALGFGYAVFPEDGADRDALLARAKHPRIRML
jgi:GAF domain-containing protein